jgi:hypothetical protein
MMRFLPDEPVRRAVADLVGDLALLNDCGNGGLPVGHVVAYQPSHELQVGRGGRGSGGGPGRSCPEHAGARLAAARCAMQRSSFRRPSPGPRPSP